MLAERLSKAWDERQRSTPIDPIMKFTADGLVLGAGTVLIPASDPGGEVSIDPLEPRLRALLTAAHLGRPSTAGASLTFARPRDAGTKARMRLPPCIWR